MSFTMRGYMGETDPKLPQSYPHPPLAYSSVRPIAGTERTSQDYAMDRPALRPRPYCAHEARELQRVDCGEDQVGFAVVCPECGAHGPLQAGGESADVARYAWSQRFGEH